MSKTENTEWKVSPADEGLRLDKWLASKERLGSRSRALNAISKGKIFVNDVEQTTDGASRHMIAGEKVRLWMDRPGSAHRRYTERYASGLHILYEDQSLLVINKPAGLLSVPHPRKPDEPSLFDQVNNHLQSHSKRTPLVVHRIDRDTSGIVIFAKTESAQKELKEQFESRSAERVYLALVHGHPQSDTGTWKDILEWNRKELKQQKTELMTGGSNTKEAVSHYRVIERLRGISLIEVRLVTGRQNQIRVQAMLHGHPLVGEKMYIDDSSVNDGYVIERQALHAHQISFLHPIERRKMKFRADLPEDFLLVIESFR